MDIQYILAELRTELQLLNETILALEGIKPGQAKRRGRPPGRKAASVETPAPEAIDSSAPVRPKRTEMSAEARKRISDAQKKRWAAAKGWPGGQ